MELSIVLAVACVLYTVNPFFDLGTNQFMQGSHTHAQYCTFHLGAQHISQAIKLKYQMSYNRQTDRAHEQVFGEVLVPRSTPQILANTSVTAP